MMNLYRSKNEPWRWVVAHDGPFLSDHGHNIAVYYQIDQPGAPGRTMPWGQFQVSHVRVYTHHLTNLVGNPAGKSIPATE